VAAPRRRTTLDVAPFRRQNISYEKAQSLEEGYEDDPFTEQLLGVIEKHKHLPGVKTAVQLQF